METQDAKKEVTQKIRLTVADPTAIGLLGLAIVTLDASSAKLGLTDGTALVIPWAIFLGAFAQLYASFSDSKIGNTFGATAFGAYGFFWLGMSMSWMTQAGVFGETLAMASDPTQLGFVYVGYMVFTLIMCFGAVSVSKVLFIIFVLIVFLFFGLAINSLFGLALGHHMAAWSELFISMLALYGCGASALNCHYGKTVMSMGKPFIAKNKI
jgi:hypothetical protein